MTLKRKQQLNLVNYISGRGLAAFKLKKSAFARATDSA